MYELRAGRGLAELPREEWNPILIKAAGAAGVAIPEDITAVVLSEPIRREAVHVFPRARCGNGNQRQAQSQQKTTATRLLVLVLVERLPRSAEKARKRPKRHDRRASAAAPVSYTHLTLPTKA